MRLFNEFERKIIDCLCSQDKDFRVGEMPKSRSLIYLMEDKIGVTKIQWNKSKTRLEIFGPNDRKKQVIKWNLLDFVTLVKWLEENRYVYLFENPKAVEKDSDGCFFISSMKPAICFFILSVSRSLNHESNETKMEKGNKKNDESELSTESIQLPVSLLKDITRIASSYVHVTQNLHDLKKNKYRTLNQVKTDKSIQIAFVVGIVSIFIGILSILLNICSYGPSYYAITLFLLNLHFHSAKILIAFF